MKEMVKNVLVFILFCLIFALLAYGNQVLHVIGQIAEDKYK